MRFMVLVPFVFFLFISAGLGQEVDTPFELELTSEMDVIQISPGMDEIWPGNDYLQKFYLNLHKVSLGDSMTIDDIDSVLVTYYGGVAPHGRTKRMWDDGKHWDGESGDGIYGYFDLLDLSAINTEDFSYHIIECCHIYLHGMPFRGTPESPELTYPTDGMIISELRPTFRWTLVPEVESYGVAVFDTMPTPATIYENMIWEEDSEGEVVAEISMEDDSVELAPGRTYYWVLWCYDEGGYVDGQWKYGAYSMEWALFSTSAVGVSGSSISIPRIFNLAQNHPNPFNSTTDILYQIRDDRSFVHTTLVIVNIVGQQIRTLVDGLKEPGYYSVQWNGRDDQNCEVASGVYFYQLSVAGGQWSETRKMVLLR
jgi:hypothetical protein